MRKQLTIEEKLEQKLYCFGGGGGGNSGGGGGGNDSGRTENTYNFNQQSKASAKEGMNYEKVLDNGVVVQDYSTPFGGMANAQVNAQAPAPTQTSGAFGQFGSGLYDNLSVTAPAPTPDINSLSAQERSLMDALNAPQSAPTNPAQALGQALQAGQFGNGQIGLGGGFSAGRVPGGFGIQYTTAFAKGGAVQDQGIASLMKRR